MTAKNIRGSVLSLSLPPPPPLVFSLFPASKWPGSFQEPVRDLLSCVGVDMPLGERSQTQGALRVFFQTQFHCGNLPPPCCLAGERYRQHESCLLFQSPGSLTGHTRCFGSKFCGPWDRWMRQNILQFLWVLRILLDNSWLRLPVCLPLCSRLPCLAVRDLE